MEPIEEISCEPCEHNGINILAELWCNDCSEGYCSECVKSHKVIKTMRNHHMISILDHMKIISHEISESCPEHNKTFSFFCVQHDSILCLSCFQSKHSKCEIVDLAEASKGSKTSTASGSFEREVKALIEQLDQGIEIDDTNLLSLVNQELTIQSQLKEVRSKFNTHFDQLEKVILSELNKKFDESTTEIRNRKDKLQQFRNSLSELIDQMTSLKEFASEKQTFIAIRQTNETLQKEKENANVALSNREGIELTFKVDEQVHSFLDIKSPRLGEIMVDRTGTLKQGPKCSDSQASLDIKAFTDISNIHLLRNKTLKIRTDSKPVSITSCVLMPNKTMVFVDNFGKRLIIHDANGKHTTDVFFTDRPCPFDATATDTYQVAVTFPIGKIIEIINVHTGSKERVITCEFYCWGIHSAEDKFYVSDTSNKLVRIMDKYGAELFRMFSGCEIYNISTHDDRISLISLTTRTLYMFDEKLKVIWELKDNRICSQKCFRTDYCTSLATDKYGNVFVVLPDSNSVVVVSHDGKSSRDILADSDNHNYPSGISYLKDTQQLLVCNALDRNAALYDIKY